MIRALRRYKLQAVAIVVMAGIGLATLAYILGHEPTFRLPSWIPGAGQPQYVVHAEFATAQAVVPGQGQPVTIAGVQVGDVSAVALRDGHAVVTMGIDHQYAPIYHNATILLRPRTALDDMTLALDKGTPSAGSIPDGGALPLAQTQPNVNFDEILANLDTDSRTYLRVLLAMGAQAFRDPSATGSSATSSTTSGTTSSTASGAPSPAAVSDLASTLREFRPLAHDARAVTAQLALRQRNLAHVIDSFGQLATRVATVDTSLATLVTAGNRTFRAIGDRDRQLAAALGELPGTLAQTHATLSSASQFAAQLGPTLGALRPLARALGPSLQATRPFLRETTPVLGDQLRPFAREVGPVVRRLRPAAAGLALSVPPLTRSLGVVNHLLNGLFYNPPGPSEGYSFWGAWLSHIGTSLTGLQDAYGTSVRSLLLATCPQLDALYEVELGNPSLGPILDLLNLPDRTQLCAEDKGLTPAIARSSAHLVRARTAP